MSQANYNACTELKRNSGAVLGTSRNVSSVVKLLNWETFVSEAKFAPRKQKCFEYYSKTFSCVREAGFASKTHVSRAAKLKNVCVF